MGARDAGAKEDLRQVDGVSESTESDGAGNLIQKSRGCARKPGSDYILMVESGNLSHGAFLRNARNSEQTLLKEAIERTDLSHLKDTSRLISVDSTPETVYEVESTGAIAVCLAASKKLHEMGEFTDMRLPDKGSGEEREKVDQNDEGEPLPGTARHREFYPEGVANILLGEWILRGSDGCNNSELLHLYMYAVIYVNKGTSKDPFLTQFSDFAVLFGNELDVEADRFAPSRWAAPGVLPVFDEDTKDGDCTFFDQERSSAEDTPGLDHADDGYEDDEIQDGELESDSSSYRVLSSKTLADVVEALIGVYYVEGGENAANHLMKWIRIQVEVDHGEMDSVIKPSNVLESIVKSVDFDALKGALNIKFSDQGLLVEAITHASQPSFGIRDFVKEVQDGLSQPGFNSFGWEIAKLRRFLVTLLNLMQVLFCGTMDEIL
ncbi:hypothetical protein GH714_038252 [Hevea brasiliensis]|uniref:RNase III domain-containing protein n=1 Tax=Hevea brasiliensis TaxID=3981 RepID=A0A6A6MN15_HEVBR|nr:hypothetical protein GH714_038252 [Hevea brasiliensis]